MTMGNRPLGKQQRDILTHMAHSTEYNRESFYPGDGWIWDTEAHTLTLLKSLHNRGLVRLDNGVYHVTEAGKAEVLKNYVVDEKKAARENKEHQLRMARNRLRKNAEPLAILATKIQTGQVKDDALYLAVKELYDKAAALFKQADDISNDYR